MLTDAVVRESAARLDEAERARRQIRMLSLDHPTMTVEDAYGYAKFARVALATNDIDMRARPHSAEELRFISDRVAGQVDVSYADLDRAPAVLLAGRGTWYDPRG